MWLPPHVGISGNKKAHALAQTNLSENNNQLNIIPIHKEHLEAFMKLIFLSSKTQYYNETKGRRMNFERYPSSKLKYINSKVEINL